MEIITWEGNQTLRKISVKINDFKEAKKIEKNLKLTLKNNSKTWVWLAAPQIWINKRMFIAMFDRKKITTIINPRILKVSNETEVCQEWCLSLPWVWWDVERYSVIKVEYFNSKWEKIVQNLDKFWAKVFQHEYDHLEWILFVDRVIWERRID